MMRSAVVAVVLAVIAASCDAPDQPAPAPHVTDVSWQVLASAPTERTDGTAAASEGRIYSIGGFGPPNTTIATVEIYDVASNAWTSGPDVPVAVNHAMAVGHEGAVYVFGGYLADGPPSDRAFVLRDGAWEELPRMPEPRGAGGAAVADGLIYVVGGVGPEGVADRTMVFDPATGRWSVAAGMRTPREHLGVAGFGGGIYAVGGRAGSLEGFGDAEVYEPSTDSWTSLPALPTPRGGMAAAASSNGFVVGAGGEEEGGTFDEAEAYDVEAGRWLSLPPMPTARHGVGVVADGTVIYVVGGGTEPGLSFTGTLEAIDLAQLP